MTAFDYDKSCRIKDVYIELPKFKAIHREGGSPILGRDDILSRLIEQLKEEKNKGNKSRAILITGFRGVGKTRLVDEALRRKYDANKKKKPYSEKNCPSIKISLAQENLTYRHLLRSMVKKMIQKEEQSRYFKVTRFLNQMAAFLAILFILTMVGGIVLEESIFGNDCENCIPDHIPAWYFITQTLVIVFFVMMIFIRRTSNLRSLKRLSERIDAAIVTENGGEAGSGTEAFGIKMSRRRSSHFPIASDKEIEFELFTILKNEKIKWFEELFRKQIKPIFVFDELDKIEVRTSIAISDKEDSKTIYTESEGSIYTTQAIRKRQEAIAGILANMKSFLTEAPAKFIFIAGREMYDASLADIAARDSFYWSIFNDIIYVPSILKSDVDKLPYTGLAGTTERFVARLLFPPLISKENVASLIQQLSKIHGDLDSLQEILKSRLDWKHYLFSLAFYTKRIKRRMCACDIKENLKRIHESANSIVEGLRGRYNVLADLKPGSIELKNEIDRFHRKNVQDLEVLNKIVQDQIRLIELYKERIETVHIPTERLSDYYNTYLKKHSSLAGKRSQIKDFKRRKIIYTLQDFILYLVYRSNGMPKKIMQLIEEHTIYCSFDDIDPNRDLVVHSGGSPDRKRYFLKMGHKTQHKIGFINFLYRPYLVAHGRSSKFRSDKLLVSTSFLVDHLLKFHNQGFSWRNLELTPEILAINKEPELRRFIARLMESLFKTHLRKIENGIHQYKFHTRLEHEIRYLSNIFEADAAAYNFTLDESVLIKKHYKAKINQQRKNYDKRMQENHVQSIAFVNSLLGDLHFFDKEYDDALVNYEDTIQSLVDKGIHTLSLKEFTFYARTQLKIGLTFDRIKAYNTALSTYLELQNQILSFSKRLNKYEFPMGDVDFQTFPLSEQAQGEIKIFSQAFLSSLESTEKAAFDGLTARHLANNFEAFDKWIEICGRLSEEDDNQFSFIKANYFTNRGNILFYKNGNIHLPIEHREDVKSVSSIYPWQPLSLKTDRLGYNYFYQAHGVNHQISVNQNPLFKERNTDYRPPISALIDYTEALYFYLKIIRSVHPNKRSAQPSLKLVLDLLRIPNRHEQTQFSGIGSTFISSLAGLISKIGDCILGFVSNENACSNITVNEIEVVMYKLNDKHLSEFFKIDNFNFIDNALVHFNSNSKNKKNQHSANLNFNSLVKSANQMHVIQLYALAANLYDQVQRDVNSSFQRRKILFILNSVNWQNQNGDYLKLLENVETSIFQKIMGAKYKTHEYTARPQILKYEFIFNPSKIFYTTYKDSKNIYNNISTALEAKETVILFSSLISKLAPYNSAVAGRFREFETNPFDSTPSVYVRYLELRNHLKKQRRKYGKSRVLVFNGNKDEEFQSICDSLFAAHTLIKLLKIHGRSALFNHSVQAEIHYMMAFWCVKLKEKITPNKELVEDEFNLYKKTLEQLIGGGIMHRLDPNHHYEKAREHYLLAISTHSQGEAYRELIDHMHYLEDDYADSFSHFGLALERFHVNSGAIRKRIKKIEDDLLKYSKFTTYDRYTNEYMPDP